MLHTDCVRDAHGHLTCTFWLWLFFRYPQRFATFSIPLYGMLCNQFSAFFLRAHKWNLIWCVQGATFLRIMSSICMKRLRGEKKNTENNHGTTSDRMDDSMSQQKCCGVTLVESSIFLIIVINACVCVYLRTPKMILNINSYVMRLKRESNEILQVVGFSSEQHIGINAMKLLKTFQETGTRCKKN